MTTRININDGDERIGFAKIEGNSVTVPRLNNETLKRQLVAQDGITTFRGVGPVAKQGFRGEGEASHSDKIDDVREDELVGHIKVLVQRAGFEATVV
jgi:hypothetical protein